MEDVKVKCCPFLVRRIEHPPILKGQGATVIDEFLPCMGDDCAAYYPGGCLRLWPPALEVGGEFTDAGIEKLRQEMRNASIMAVPDGQPEPWQDCHNCGNYETKTGCDHCISSVNLKGHRNSIPSRWKPKEGQKWAERY